MTSNARDNYFLQMTAEDDLFPTDSFIPHCAVVVVLDTSHSMWGEGLRGIHLALNALFDTFSTQIVSANLDIATISMGDTVRMLEEFVPFEQSKLRGMNIRPKGDTPIGAAVNLALDKLAAQQALYRKNGWSAVVPHVVILSDGESSDDISEALGRLQRLIRTGGVVSHAVATVNNPDMDTLLALGNGKVYTLQQCNMQEAFAQVGQTISTTYEDEVVLQLEEKFPQKIDSKDEDWLVDLSNGTSSTTSCAKEERFLILDGCNIIHWRRDGKHPTMAPLLALTNYFDRIGWKYQALFDAATPYKLQAHDRTLFEKLLKERPNEFAVVPAGIRADDFILERADDSQALVISNDKYRQYTQKYPWINDGERVVSGMVLGDKVFLPKLDGVRAPIE